MTNKVDIWDKRFLALAAQVSTWSKDPSTQVGAVIADCNNRKVVGLGYNGFPRGVHDKPERYEDRDVKYKYIVHAEVNAILNAVGPVVGMTIYTWPFPPCADCAGLIIQAGIKRIVCPPPATDAMIRRWGDQMAVADTMFREAGVKVVSWLEQFVPDSCCTAYPSCGCTHNQLTWCYLASSAVV